jgi:hypothetical protein
MLTENSKTAMIAIDKFLVVISFNIFFGTKVAACAMRILKNRRTGRENGRNGGFTRLCLPNPEVKYRQIRKFPVSLYPKRIGYG